MCASLLMLIYIICWFWNFQPSQIQSATQVGGHLSSKSSELSLDVVVHHRLLNWGSLLGRLNSIQYCSSALKSLFDWFAKLHFSCHIVNRSFWGSLNNISNCFYQDMHPLQLSKSASYLNLIQSNPNFSTLLKNVCVQTA